MDPRGETPAANVSMAPRVSGLDGATIALVDNTKINAGNLLNKLSYLLESELADPHIVRYSKTDATRPAPSSLIRQITRECDVAILAIGD